MALVLGILAAYAWTLGRYFTGEDFLILGRLLSPEGAAVVSGSFTGPWLGIELVQFYRPVATTLLALEAWLFGANPLPYHLVHLLVHGLNTWLFFRWLCSGPFASTSTAAASAPSGSTAAGCAALLFGLYPLHPNTVTFVASFATLFAATFLLLALLAFERDKPLHVLAAYALALGCYEGAAVLPALLLMRHLCRYGLGRKPGSTSSLPSFPWRGAWLHLATFTLLAVYFVLRRSIFGVSLGGYAHMSERLRWPWPWLGDLATSFRRLVYPNYEQAAGAPGWLPEGLTLAATVVVLLALLVLAVSALRAGSRPAKAGESEATCSRRRHEARAGAALALGLLWVVISQAPFSFVPVVPGNGRYWYLAAMGLALAVCGLAMLVAKRLPVRVPLTRRSNTVVVVATLLLLVCWLPILLRDLGRYVEAGELARRIQQQVLELGAPTEAGGAPPVVFLHGYPQWLYSSGGAPVAKVFHWGLHDAMRPPFVESESRVYPLPAPEAAPCAGDVDTGRAPRDRGFKVLRWTEEGLEPLPGADPPARAAFQAPTRQLLVVIAAGNVRCQVLAADADAATPALPRDFLSAMHALYEAPVYWWVETRGTDGRWLGSTPVTELRPEEVRRLLATDR